MVAPSRPSLRSSTRRSLGLAESPPTAILQNTIITPPTRRAKRTIRSSSLNNETHTIKKQRIQLDIAARPKAPVRSRNAKDLAPVAQEPSDGVLTSLAVPSPISNSVSQRATENLSGTSTHHVTIGSTTAPAASSGKDVRIQQEDKRSLRSQGGGSRLRSELSLYFPNYDEIINDEPKEPGNPPLKRK